MKIATANVMFWLSTAGLLLSGVNVLLSLQLQIADQRAFFWRVSFPYLVCDWYLLACCVQAIGSRRPESARLTNKLIFGMSAAVCLLVGYAAGLELRHLKPISVLHLLTYALVVAIARLALKSLRGVPQPVGLPAILRGPYTQIATALVTLSLLVVTGTGAAYSIRLAPPLSPNPGARLGLEFDQWYTAQPRERVGWLQPDVVTIVVFTDYMCPACKIAYTGRAALEQALQSRNTGRVQIVYRDLPLDVTCNSTLSAQVHPLACEAAAAVRMARRSGRQRALEAWIFDHQQGLTTSALWEAAQRLSGVEKTDGLYAAVLNEIRSDVQFAETARVQSVPTMFVNQVRVRGAIKRDQLENAIRLETARASVSTAQ